MAETDALLWGLSSIFLLGISAQWLAWRVRVPSILLLLAAGFVAGPVAGWLSPDAILGELLFPVVSLSVAVVLFEGSLGLRFSELRGVSAPLRNLLTVGVLVNWAICTGAAVLVLEFSFPIALLLGAMLTVTGPTVVGPMLRHIRPSGKVSSAAKWEGIVVDPIGAMLAVLVFEAIQPGDPETIGVALSSATWGLARTILVGGVLGFGAAWALAGFLSRHWIPDHLQSPMTLTLVIAAFLVSNRLQHESGLLTVTVMGIVLANQKQLMISHILEFKENLTVLLVSSLFILLSARIELSEFAGLGWRGPLYVLVLLLVARPAAVFLSTIGSELTRNERIFLAWLAPRGIVAAAVASVFALRLEQEGTGLVPVTFLVIVGTVVVYGFTAYPLARSLGLATANPQGVLIASAHPGARAIAHGLQAAGFKVLLVDMNHENTRAARMQGLQSFLGNILSERAMEDINLGGMGRFIALTPNDEVNSLAAIHFSEVFGSANVFQLPPESESERKKIARHHLHGRFLFRHDANYAYLDERFAAGAVVKSTMLTSEFTYADFLNRYGASSLPLFVVNEMKQLIPFTTDVTLEPKPGQSVIALVDVPPSQKNGDDAA